MSSTYIRSQLDGILSTWAMAQYPPIPIAYENVAFTKPTNSPYLET